MVIVQGLLQFLPVFVGRNGWVMRCLLGLFYRFKQFCGVFLFLYTEGESAMNQALAQEYIDRRGKIQPRIASAVRLCASVCLGSPSPS